VLPYRVQYIVDRVGTLGNHRRTATGGFLVEATLARVGVLDYVVDGRVVRHLNTPAVLQASLDEIATAPVTNRHPKQFVDTKTYAAVAKGHVVGAPVFVDGHLKATLAIHDAELIADIEMGSAREVSMGYLVRVADAPGATESGEVYDVVREAIVWNHIAIVPKGRAGKSVRLLLDSQDIPDESETLMLFKIDGADVDADKAQAAFDSAYAKLEGELSVARTKLAEAEAKLAVAVSDEAIDAAVEARLAKKAEDDARAARLETVKKAFPDLKLEGRSQDAIDALYAVADKQIAKDPEGLDGLAAKTDARPEVKQPKPKKPSARDRMLEEQRKALGNIAAE
jgi:hypothetical protein